MGHGDNTEPHSEGQNYPGNYRCQKQQTHRLLCYEAINNQQQARWEKHAKHGTPRNRPDRKNSAYSRV